MPPSWSARHETLLEILRIQKDGSEDDRMGVALDDSKQHSVDIKTQITKLRFHNKDLKVIGVLEAGQFATIEVVKCRLDNNTYVRKTIDKTTASRCSQQCFPQTERDILLLAKRSNATFVPHLIASYQTSSLLHMIMPYATGGTLSDVLGSAPDGEGISERDLRWWIPQAVSAIEWCHDQGFCHRDIKPNNFVITGTSHIILIDFGSAAPLLPPSLTEGEEHVRLVPRQYCYAPCGTCDYIAPEVLTHFEEEMMVFEAGNSLDDVDASASGTWSHSRAAKNSLASQKGLGCYGAEVDWWSLGALIFELFYGTAPFFAQDIKRTYHNILHHKTQLKFDVNKPISTALRGLISGFLRDFETRVGRRGSKEVKDMAFFRNVSWDILTLRKPPDSLLLPHFAYTEDAEDALKKSALTHSRGSSFDPGHQNSESFSRPAAFSQYFRSSASSGNLTTPRRGGSILTEMDKTREKDLSSFIGFSWGPARDAFPSQAPDQPGEKENLKPLQTPRTLQVPTLAHTPHPAFFTPLKKNGIGDSNPHTLPRNGTVQRTVGRRAVTDREAMEMLVECIGMSAQKKVFESGRKPRSMRKLPKQSYYNNVPLPLRFTAAGGGVESPKEINSIRQDIIITRNDQEDSTTSTMPLSPSPSPTPRPGSAMSTTLTLTRRSFTPTATMSMAHSGSLSANQTTLRPTKVPVLRQQPRRKVVEEYVRQMSVSGSQDGLTVDQLAERLDKFDENLEMIRKELEKAKLVLSARA